MGGSTIDQLQHPCREGGRGQIREAQGEGKGGVEGVGEARMRPERGREGRGGGTKEGGKGGRERGAWKGRRRECKGGGAKRLGVKEEAEEVDEMGEMRREGLRTQSIVITCMSWKTQECQGHMGALPLMQP